MNNKGSLGLIGLLLVVAIISIAAYFMFKQYLGKPTGMDQNTADMAKQAGIDTTSQVSILSSVKSTINSVQAAEQGQQEQYANALGQ